MMRLLALAALALFATNADAHGFLRIPAARNYVANLQGTEDCPHCLAAGGKYKTPLPPPLPACYCALLPVYKPAQASLLGLDLITHARTHTHTHTHTHSRAPLPLPLPLPAGPGKVGAGFTWPEGKHGECGNHWDQPLKYDAPGPIQNTYTEGGVIEVTMDITAYHKGRFALYLCPSTDISDACFKQFPLGR
jgi:hypothetical protein